MDADRFAAYWGSQTPRMHIPGFTHPVKDYTLEDVLSMTGYIPPKKGKKKKWFSNGNGNGGSRNFRKKSAWDDSERSDNEDEMYGNPASTISHGAGVDEELSTREDSSSIPVDELVKRVNESEIDYDLIGLLVRHLIQVKDTKDDGSILVFLPGAPEIGKAGDIIQRICKGMRMLLLPLHGGLQPRDQQRVFHKAQYGTTKVILSTSAY